MRQVAFDESGNSGQNLLDSSQPVYVLASVAREEEEVAGSVADLLRDSQFDELKFSDMRRLGEEQILDAVFSSELLQPSCARAVPADKAWMVAGKIVDLLLEPSIPDTHGFYASGAHRKIASILYHQGPREGGSGYWAAFQAAFVAAVRSPRNLDRIQDLSSSLEAARAAAANTAVGVFLDEIPSDPSVLAGLVPGGDDELDPALSGLVEQLHHWSQRIGERFRVVHDDSGVVERWADLLERLSDPSSEQRSFEVGNARFEFPLQAPEIVTVDSEQSSTVQLADVLSGAVAWCLRERVRGNDVPAQWSKWDLGRFIDFFRGRTTFCWASWTPIRTNRNDWDSFRIH